MSIDSDFIDHLPSDPVDAAAALLDRFHIWKNHARRKDGSWPSPEVMEWLALAQVVADAYAIVLPKPNLGHEEDRNTAAAHEYLTELAGWTKRQQAI